MDKEVVYSEACAISRPVSMYSEEACVTATPGSCLQDEEVVLNIQGLRPYQHITLVATCPDSNGAMFCAHAHFRSDVAGNISTNESESLGGSYTGVWTMGLLSALKPAPHERENTRFFRRRGDLPNHIEFIVHGGHVDMATDCSSSSKVLCSTSHVRHYMAPGVTRTPVTQGKLRATFFLPAGGGPFPGVVDVFGTAGGLVEFRAAQLASRGFAAIAVAYQYYQDLPNNDFLDFDYFKEAVQYLLKHDRVVKNGVGCVGVSKGADIVLSMATYIPEVRCVVSISGCNAVLMLPTKIDAYKTIQALPLNFYARTENSDGTSDFLNVFQDPLDHPESVIPIDKANAEFLFLVGLDDMTMTTNYFADLAVDKLKQAGRKNFELVKYPDTGHLLEPSYSPHCHSSFHRIHKRTMWGGKLRSHCEAQVHAWVTTISFLRRHLITSHL